MYTHNLAYRIPHDSHSHPESSSESIYPNSPFHPISDNRPLRHYILSNLLFLLSKHPDLFHCQEMAQRYIQNSIHTFKIVRGIFKFSIVHGSYQFFKWGDQSISLSYLQILTTNLGYFCWSRSRNQFTYNVMFVPLNYYPVYGRQTRSSPRTNVYLG
jgi:hypothetical protein